MKQQGTKQLKHWAIEISHGLALICCLFACTGFLYIDQLPAPAFITELDQQRERKEEFSPKFTFNGFSVVKTNDLPNRRTLQGEAYAYQENN